MDTVQQIMAAEGGTTHDIVSLKIYMTDLAQWRQAADIRRPYFKGSPPASTLLHIVSLARPELKVEIEATAYLGDPGKAGGHMPKRATNYAHLPPPSGLFSYGVRAGGWVHLAGATARGTPAEHGDIVAQTDAVLGKIKGMLEAEGGTMRNVVRHVIYITEPPVRYRETAPILRRYYGPNDLPASTLVQVVGLAEPHFKVEIEVVAYLGS